ncbi:MAG: hypothetical protein BWY13_00227 [Euryarchaeota archaeon ADurb.Bin190]|nr:MAG: hypothetical protein BWY13_00227 [Euryarchaeota archaeon ADurb.Bin190]
MAPVSAPIFFFLPTRSDFTSRTISSATGRATSLSMRAISRAHMGSSRSFSSRMTSCSKIRLLAFSKKEKRPLALLSASAFS